MHLFFRKGFLILLRTSFDDYTLAGRELETSRPFGSSSNQCALEADLLQMMKKGIRASLFLTFPKESMADFTVYRFYWL